MVGRFIMVLVVLGILIFGGIKLLEVGTVTATKASKHMVEP